VEVKEFGRLNLEVPENLYFKMKSEIAVLLKKFSFGLYSIRYAHALGAFLRGRTNFFSDNTETLK
jgi:hypothetical protein